MRGCPCSSDDMFGLVIHVISDLGYFFFIAGKIESVLTTSPFAPNLMMHIFFMLLKRQKRVNKGYVEILQKTITSNEDALPYGGTEYSYNTIELVIFIITVSCGEYMKVYIAGKLGTEGEKQILEQIDSLCKKHGLKTFLPHRDVGIAQSIEDVDAIFEGDITEGFKNVSLVIASLDGLHVGSGTAWELGYAYAKGIPAIGIKTDESVAEGLPYLSALLIGSMEIVRSFEELEEKIKAIINLRA